MLTGFFKKNEVDVDARKYLYREFFEHYVRNRSQHCWTKRKGKRVVGLVNAASLSEGERYNLRLLYHVHGPTSYNDLLTINGARYSTFMLLGRGFFVSNAIVT